MTYVVVIDIDTHDLDHAHSEARKLGALHGVTAWVGTVDHDDRPHKVTDENPGG